MAAHNSRRTKSARSASAKAAQGGMTKTAFVLSLPENTPAADVIAAAAEKGMRLSAKHVYKIRSANRSKFEQKSDAAAGSSAMAANGSFRTASAYIKAQPLDMPTMDVIADGRRHGFEINRHLIYVTRAAMRKKLAQGQPVTRVFQGRATAVSSAGAPIENQFRRLVIELGMGRARALVAEVEARWQSLMIGG